LHVQVGHGWTRTNACKHLKACTQARELVVAYARSNRDQAALDFLTEVSGISYKFLDGKSGATAADATGMQHALQPDLGTVERPTRAFLLQEYEASRKLEVRQERTAFLKAVSNILAQSTIQDCSNPELEVSVRGLMRLASSFRYASLLTVTVTVRPVMVPSGGSCFVTVSPCRLQPTRFYAKHGHEFPIATAVYKRFMSTQVTTVRLEVSGGVCFFTICSAES